MSAQESRLPALIINADDVGNNLPRTKGIILAMTQGVVTNTTLLVNFDHSHTAVEMLRAEGLLAQCGLHLNLTEGEPLSPPDQIPSLVRPCADGCGKMEFLGKKGFWAACSAGQLSLTEVLLESRAQIDWFSKAVGQDPLFMNGHNHCHIAPGLVEAMAALCHAHGIQHVRIPIEAATNQAGQGLCPVCADVSRYGILAKSTFTGAGVHSTDAFVGLSFCGSHYSIEQFVDAVKGQLGATTGVPGTSGTSSPQDTGVGISSARHPSCEAMVHPGYCDPMDEFSSSPDRETELNTLCDPRLKMMLAKLVRLESYSCLKS